MAKKLIWNAGHHLTNVELAHCPLPESQRFGTLLHIAPKEANGRR